MKSIDKYNIAKLKPTVNTHTKDYLRETILYVTNIQIRRIIFIDRGL